jgi:formylglycine-generating enzyme required for sulfatase activity
MAEVFISYKSERRRAAEHMAAVLERYGYSVWFDYQLIKGRDFGSQIDRKVREAKALVVLWCARSVESRWVAEKVDLAHELEILIPVKIEACTLPVGFRRQDYIDLSEWDGAPRSHHLDPLIDALEQKIGRPSVPDFRALREYETTWRRFGALPLSAFAFDRPIEIIERDRGMPERSRSAREDATDSGSPSPLSEQAIQEALALEHWQAIKSGNDPAELRAFINSFGASKSAPLARNALQRLEAAAWSKLPNRREEAALERFLAEGWDGEKAGLARSELQVLKDEKAALDREAEEKARREADERARSAALWAARRQAWARLFLREELRPAYAVLAVAATTGLLLYPLISRPPVSVGEPREVLKPASTDSLTSKPDAEPPVTPIATVTARPSTPSTFRDCSDCPEMVVVPAGKFMMGSTDGDPDEKPVHEVTIGRSIAVGKFEVTFADWEACVAGGGCASNKSPSDQGWGKAKRPVINVSWNEAKEYVTWLARKTGQPYLLLTEAEWEYAARAGTTTKYAFGDTIDKRQAQFSESRTAEVGSFPANAWGIHDMHGNVWEWVEDCYQENYDGAPSDGSARSLPNCSFRVLRGGFWLSSPHILRSATRLRDQPDFRLDIIGFRVARTL